MNDLNDIAEGLVDLIPSGSKSSPILKYYNGTYLQMPGLAGCTPTTESDNQIDMTTELDYSYLDLD
jgi:hypothetical protein